MELALEEHDVSLGEAGTQGLVGEDTASRSDCASSKLPSTAQTRDVGAALRGHLQALDVGDAAVRVERR